MSALELTLLAPGLLSHPPQDPAAIAALTRLLARADSTAITDSPDYLPILARLAGQQDAIGTPTAAYAWLTDFGSAPTEPVLFASPCYCYADKDRVLMMAHHGLRLTDDEAEGLLATLNAHLRVDGMEMIAATPSRWYLRGATVADGVGFAALPAVIGKDIHRALPQGDVARPWRSLFNELQMLLHTCPVNQARQQRKAPPVNTVWFWGAGDLPVAGPLPWGQVWSNDVVARGLARWSGVPDQVLPADYRQWLAQAQASAQDQQLMVMTAGCDLAGMVGAGSDCPWQGDWLDSLYRGLASGELASIRCWFGGARVYQLRRWHHWRFWRRSVDLGKVSRDNTNH